MGGGGECREGNVGESVGKGVGGGCREGSEGRV